MGLLIASFDPFSTSIAQQALLLTLSALQLAFLLALQPFTERGIQVVEAASSIAEVIVFVCSLSLAASAPTLSSPPSIASLSALASASSSAGATAAGVIMLLAVALALLAQLLNQ